MKAIWCELENTRKQELETRNQKSEIRNQGMNETVKS